MRFFIRFVMRLVMHSAASNTALILSLGLFLLTACNESESPTEVSTTTTTTTSTQEPAKTIWRDLIQSHTSGRISRDSEIRIQFKNPITSTDKIDNSADGIFSIKPSTKGKAVFESTQSIVFLPDEPLVSGQKYSITLEPNGLKGLSATDASYKFDFSIFPMEYELEISALQIDPDEQSQMILGGQALFSDRVDADKVSQLMTATLQNKSLKLVWQADESNKRYRFIIKDLKRETFATDLQLHWDGKPLGIKTSGSREITIPSINEFKVIDIARITPAQDKPYIQITLSDSRNETQNLKGLIQLEPIPDSKHPTPKAVPFTLSSAGNIIKLFPKDGTTGQFNVAVNAALEGARGTSLGEKTNKTITLDSLKPGIRFVGKGSILPESKTLEIPFEAANVNAVQVTAFVINPDNIGQFLQINKLSGDDQLGRVGRHLWRKTIPLSAANPAQWNRYTFDASELLRSYPGGLFRLELSIDRRFSSYKCPANTLTSKTINQPLTDHEDINVTENSGWDGIEQYGYAGEGVEGQDYDWQWENRNKPCTDAYFQYEDNPVKASRNFIASNIGLLAKQDGHGKLLIIATDLKTSNPLANVNLQIYNFQHQPLATTKTNTDGIAEVTLSATPFLLIAQHSSQHGNEKGYLKLNGKTALSVSHFDVGGEKLKKGLKGIIYGERGVWRPGDDIFLTFVLQDKDQVIPEQHPVSMQLINPKGRVVQTLTNTSPIGDFYTFKFNTDEDAETGKWLVKAKLGGNTFSKTLTIETVRPNRLKIDLSFTNETNDSDDTDTLYGYEPLATGKLFSQWLHGASAGGLKTDVSVRFREKKTRFERFTDYVFDDPSRSLDSDDQKILEGRLNEAGELAFNKQFIPKSKSAGMLSAWFTTRVFEEGGAFSTSKQFMDYHPYRDYVGMKLPKGDATRNMLLTDQQHTIELASLDAHGNPSELDRVQVTLYKIDWKWWWDKSNESLAAYSNANHSRKLQQGIVQTRQGRGQWNFSIKYPDWGRYLVRACDLDGKHCTGKTVYIDWPGWAGRAQEQGNSAASTLSLFSDKKAYTVGETAIVQLPKASQGRALVTVENGSDILSQQWVEFDSKKDDKESGNGSSAPANADLVNSARQQVEILITEQMAPNIYVNVTLLQPHQNKLNDRPIRLLGIIPLLVSDPTTHLKPVISADDEWKPLSTQTLQITEASGKAMDYTLAMVDEGLLGLTRYKTPDLHKYFYRKEALGIKSWDLFDDVVGAYGGKLERLLALGGGDDVQIDDAANRPKRFPPVVQFLGSFHLEKGENQIHEIKLPAYIGAVRLMVIAGSKAAYGQADKSIFIRQPLIMQPSLPRVLSVNEEAIIPVTLFSTKEDIKDVELSVTVDDLLQVVDDKQTTIHFEKTGDKLGFLRVKAGSKTGQAHLHFVATSSTNGTLYRSESDVYLDIRNPNKDTRRVANHVIEAGQTDAFTLIPHGIKGSNSAVFEASTTPPLGLDKHIDYLVQYPHGCLEQTTSSAFPQLYLSQLLDMGEEKEKKISHHVSRAIDRIRNFQQSDGSLSYWPGGNNHNKWSSLYAGHFLIEAQRLGYQVPTTLLSHWLRYQSGIAQRWLAGAENYAYVQAYRLYVLTLAGKPELGAMNRFREGTLSKSQGVKAKWLLASAYKLAGQQDAAQSIIEGLVANPETATEQHSDTFSTRLSDLGLRLNALTTLGKTQDADHFMQAIADELGNNSHNTHGIAWALMAVSRHISEQGKSSSSGGKNGIMVKYALNKQGNSAKGFSETKSQKAYLSQALGKLSGDKLTLKVKNDAATKLYISVINKGIPAAGNETDTAAGLKLEVTYGKPNSSTEVDISAPIEQGKDIHIKVSVHNTSGQQLENLALTQLIPSGMEIHNTNYKLNAKYDHQDVRDDRIYTYFSLKKDETKHFSIIVNPAYTGHFYFPAIQVEAMYKPSIQARKKGQWIDIESSTTAVEASEETVDATSTSDQTNNQADTATISATKSWLYNEPDKQDKSKMYLVKGDKVSIVKRSTDWLLIRFKGKSLIEKWIAAEDIN